MTKHILLFISFFMYSYSIFAGCDSRLYFLYDNSPSVTGSGFESEATDIIDILNDLTRNTVNMVLFSEFLTKSESHQPRATYFSTPNPNHGNHSPIASVIAAAAQDCEASCGGVWNNGTINSQCIFIYWSDNVVSHPNPYVMMRQAQNLPRNIIEINSAGRAFIDLSFAPALGIAAPLRGLAEDIKQIALDSTYGGIDYRGGDYITPMSRTELECSLKRIVSLFNSQL